MLENNLDYWHSVSIPQRRTQASYFELYFGRRQERWHYNKRCLARARRTLKPVLGEHAGMQDLFVPVLHKGKLQAFMTLGSFQAGLPGRDEIWGSWKRLRRGPYAGEPEEFAQYVSARLDTPVLEKPLRAPLAKVLAQAGAALLGLADAVAASQALDRFKRGKMSQGGPWRMWHYAQSRRDRLNFDQGPFESGEVMPWDAEEFGIRRSPDTALAFCPRDPGPDQAHAMASVARLQWEVWQYCREKKGLVAGRGADMAALVLASCDKAAKARGLAVEIQRFLARRLGQEVLASWDCRPSQAGRISEAIAGAEQALRLAAARGLSMLEAGPITGSAGSMEKLEALAFSLASDWAEGRRDSARLAQRQFAEAAVFASAGSMEKLGLHLRWGLAPLLGRLSRRGLVPGMEPELGNLPSQAALVRRFLGACESLGAQLLDPGAGQKEGALRRALEDLRQRPESTQRLEGLARGLGLSAPSFSRLFKRGAGSGFAQARTQARLEKARRLLKESELSLQSVAQECGWAAQAHFCRVFKRAEGLSPGMFRKKYQLKS